MDTLSLAAFSNQLADVIATRAASVVQVHGRRRLASGIVFGEGLVMTMAHGLGGDEGLRVRADDGAMFDAELRGWDPATSLVVLRADHLHAPIAAPAADPARVGHLVLAIGRSWSGGLTAAHGIVSIIGGPLPTGHGRSIDRVIRTTAVMHSGYVGGALLDANGGVLGVPAHSEIRGLRVVIPADIAWRVATSVAEHGTPRRGYLGVAGQTARIPAGQSGAGAQERGVVVIGVSDNSPAAAGGILVGDVITSFDEKPVRSPVDLLELLEGDRVGRTVRLGLLRGGQPAQVSVTVIERPAR
jgi:S1-C subfamily serine protease